MRISTSTIYEQGIFNIQRNQLSLARLQEQLSTGRRIVSPSDDPVGAARALEVTQSRDITAQYARNADAAEASIALEETALTRYTALLQDVKTLTVNAGNGALTEKELKSLAGELRGRYTELLSIANSTDANGLYLFAGFQGTTIPFTETAPGVVAYNGDDGQREIQVAPSRQIAVSDSGADAFQRLRTGNGTFETAAAAGNTGTGIVTRGLVRNPAAWDTLGQSQQFEVRFFRDGSVNPPVTTYDVVDTVNNVSLTTGAPPAAGPFLRTYQPGATIVLSPPNTTLDAGIELSVTGEPATGDTFTVAPSVNQDIFTTLSNLITTLETSGPASATANAALFNRLNTALNNFDNALDANLTVRASIGSRMKEIDANRAAAADLGVQYEKTLSQYQDLDYAKAISELSFNQVALEAAQKSFLRVQGLTLFEFL
ncbi:MAG: flagellar hook-associated protein FlgL [Burkholderiales bacterium]|nr:flagellar hook-associated protein FlgL [Burkholderiales bacterium]